MSVPDVQSRSEGFPKVYLPWVGVEGIRYPVYVYYPLTEIFMQTLGSFNVYCSLNPEVKGVHMSRFYEVIQDVFSEKKLLTQNVSDTLGAVTGRLENENARVEVSFTYLVSTTAPVSEIDQFLPVEVKVTGIRMKGYPDYILISVDVPYTSLCPCSKEISQFGAHNQRSVASVTVTTPPNNEVLFEDLVGVVENVASAPIRECLKRVDEKYVTERAYLNPVFVEDMVRLIGLELEKRALPYLIKVTHFESIHAHNAVAFAWSSDFNFALFNYLGN
ncbi:GTP cyclohydrolase I FolE2 [bacterium]|nr:GTP cyclohydrolase I FolE2 [bacterium]